MSAERSFWTPGLLPISFYPLHHSVVDLARQPFQLREFSDETPKRVCCNCIQASRLMETGVSASALGLTHLIVFMQVDLWHPRIFAC
jgi:hypothetical protein